MSERDVSVTVVKGIAEYIQTQPWFKERYRDLQDFVDDAVRSLKEKWEALDKLRLPEGFLEWCRRRGITQQIVAGKKDILEALREFQTERGV